ncbi:MAG: type II CRISPR-associated endonuclease Cas1 [Phycisphaerae bacterium]|nr:type II CRISPR-associated endonuclease Cas1 [Phycisphaerae bacterium]
MIKRIIEISSEPLVLTVRDNQLRLHQPASRGGERVSSIPCEDIGVLVIEHPQTMCSQRSITRLLEFGAAVVYCGRDHLPAGVALPVSQNTQVVTRIQEQIQASKPLQKNLWKQLVVAKIRHHAEIVKPHDRGHYRKLSALAREVRSGDPTNVEAQGARYFWNCWRQLLGESDFRRDPDGNEGLNAMLNYGYAILRAGLGRAIVSAGFTPVLGIHHHNRSNAFSLADDLIEPIRPLVDQLVLDAVSDGLPAEINTNAKRLLLGLLHQTVRFDDTTGPLMVIMHRYVADFGRCLRGQAKKLCTPKAVKKTDEPNTNEKDF